MAVKEKPQPLTIHVSPKAAEHVKHFARLEGLEEGFGIRVAVKGGGCSGLTYDLSIVKAPGENDKVIEEHGLRLFVDKKSYVFLAGTTLDYSDGLNGKGFVFHNPNAKTTCGCGTSFSV
ncbi:MAG: iron-sulfur cluster assembly accessory protein [Chloroflexi bacterium]|nr:iron-sulfur cluster assembly accessory protein [Chloroflexota bacterium]